ncbi:hypothetical protein CI610_03331 [invertebrate metagenome]|uniref:Reverse transcriptase domain-containing protein n=1 Tax=invertebrate metagenome TaxID=1711999 RepID=A0A2H9T3G3_9ZZZZ
MGISGKKCQGFFCLDPKGLNQDRPSDNPTNTINLSSRTLNPDEIQLLDRGLKFIPTPRNISSNDFIDSAKDLGRKLKITHFFNGKSKSAESKKFVDKSQWNPPESAIPSNIQNSVKDIFKDLSKITVSKEQPNLNLAEKKAITSLKNDQSIVIKKADKGSATVILDRADYIWEVERQLNNPKHYRQLDSPIYPKTSAELSNIIHRLGRSKHLTPKQVTYLNPKENPKPRHVYILPKIHKAPGQWSDPYKIPPGRPIISDVESESYRIAEYIDHFLAPLSMKHPAYLKDTNDFINKIKNLTIPKDSLLVSLDVDSMYTNIDNRDGLRAVGKIFQNNPDPDRPDLEILEMLQSGLERNDFEFNGKWYLQISGTAMGKKFAPSYANIFMADFEKEALAKCTKQPLVYVRFLDDIFIIWTHSRSDFDDFFDTLNNHHPCIKLKATISNDSIDFLDRLFKGPNSIKQEN